MRFLKEQLLNEMHSVHDYKGYELDINEDRDGDQETVINGVTISKDGKKLGEVKGMKAARAGVDEQVKKEDNGLEDNQETLFDIIHNSNPGFDDFNYEDFGLLRFTGDDNDHNIVVSIRRLTDTYDVGLEMGEPNTDRYYNDSYCSYGVGCDTHEEIIKLLKTPNIIEYIQKHHDIDWV